MSVLLAECVAGRRVVNEIPGEASPGQPAPGAHLAGVDAVRLLAAVVVVWIHAAKGPDLGADPGFLGRFAVSFFTLVSVLFAFTGIARSRIPGFGAYALARLQRIALPFVVWCVLYLAWDAVMRLLTRREEVFRWDESFLWNGARIHLWFLPFILLASLAVYPAARAVARRPQRAGPVALAAGLLGLLLALLPLQDVLKDQTDLVYYGWLASPSICWGVVFGCLRLRGGEQWLRGPVMAVFGLVLLAGGTTGVFCLGRVCLLENLAGLGAALFGFANLRGPVLALLARGGALAFGVYLSHLLFLDLSYHVLARLGVSGARPLEQAVSATLLTFLLSALFTECLRRTRRLRWLVL